MEDALAVALEPEVTRLDHARVDGTHGHLVDLFSLDAEEIGDADDRCGPGGASPGVVPGAVRAVEPQRLEPRVAGGIDAPLLRDLALEEVDFRALGRHGR